MALHESNKTGSIEKQFIIVPVHRQPFKPEVHVSASKQARYEHIERYLLFRTLAFVFSIVEVDCLGNFLGQ